MKEIAKDLLDIKAVFLSPSKPFTWASGIQSPIYCDNRLTLSYPVIRKKIEQEMAKIIKETYSQVEILMGTSTAGIPHAAYISALLDLPMGYVRSRAKSHGLKITDTVYERILNDDYQGMEKSTIIRKRAYDEMLALDHIYPNKKILIVTHSHFIKALFTQLDQKITFKSSLANGSLNFVEIDKGKIIHFKFNQ